MKGGYMIQNKRGLSAIVTTLLVVLLVLVAVGIVWGVVSGVLRTGAENLEFSAKCLNVDVRASTVDCAVPTACVVTLTRTGTETEAISGVKLVFVNSTASSSVIDVPGDIEVLAGVSTTQDSQLSVPTSVEVTAYFDDGSGNDQLCGTTTKDF